MGLVEQGEGTEHAMIGQHTATKDHATGSHKAVRADHDRFTVLPVELEINGMGEQLGAITGDGGEGPDRDPVGDINVVVFNDGRMGTKVQFGTTLGLVGEVRRAGAGIEAGDPIATANRGVFAQFKNIEIHSHSKEIDAETGLHAQAAEINLVQPDPRGGIHLIAIKALKHQSLERPRQQYDRDMRTSSRRRKALMPGKRSVGNHLPPPQRRSGGYWQYRG